MQIRFFNSLGLYESKINNQTTKKEIRMNNSLTKDTFQRSVTFGWCEPHQIRRTEVSQLFNNALKLKQKEAELKRKAGELLDIANKSALDATKYIINFANRIKGEAEFVPLWSIKTDSELQKTLDESPIFGDPVQNLIGLKNISKFKMNNPKYSEELNQQGAGSLQIHTTIILTEQAQRNLEKSDLSAEDKKEVQEMLKIAKDKVDETFGEGTYNQLVKISSMGENPTLEEKRESNRILKEIDSKARSFNFGEEFNVRLKNLVDRLHIKFHDEHPHQHHHHEHEHEHQHDNSIKIIYHSHGPNGEHIHEHEHHHEHQHEHQHRHNH